MSRELYNGLPPHESTPTSLAAAVQIHSHAGTLRYHVLKAIEQRGPAGATDDELEALLDMRHQTLSARRRELVLLGAIIDSGRTRKTRSGRGASVWVTAEPQIGLPL